MTLAPLFRRSMEGHDMAWNLERGPRIAFLGTGAQGASIGADFALAGLDVTFIEQWPDHVNAIRETASR